MKKEWLKELARDLIAFGSIPFLALTVARVSVMTVYYPMQFIVSAVLFFALSWAFKADPRAGAGFILVVFTSLYYGSWLFVAFAALVYAGIIISLFYLGKERAKILKGILLGAVSSGAGYLIVRQLFF